jgi:hypothetical protein
MQSIDKTMKGLQKQRLAVARAHHKPQIHPRQYAMKDLFRSRQGDPLRGISEPKKQKPLPALRFSQGPDGIVVGEISTTIAKSPSGQMACT